jgi:glycosyltransferase involved in cell wall biosynthesis
MDTEMGLHILLQAVPAILAHSSNVKVVIIGRTGPLTVDANRLASNYAGRIFVKPDMPLADLPSWYAAATILVAPTQSDRACGSLAAAEAMASGKPVVAAKVGGIPEIVVHDQTGLLVQPEDPKAIVDAIRQLLNNPDLMASMGKNGRQRAEMHFDKDKTNRCMAEVLEQAIANRKQRPVSACDALNE